MRGLRWAALALVASAMAAPPMAAQSPYQVMAYQNALRLKQQQLAYQSALRVQQQQRAAYQNAMRQQQAHPVAAHQIPQANPANQKSQTNAASQIMAYQNTLKQQQLQAAKLLADALAIQKSQQKEIAANPAAYTSARLVQIHRDWQINSLALQRQGVAGEVALLAQEETVLGREGLKAPPGLDAQLKAMQKRLAALNVSLKELGVGSVGGGGGGDGCAAASAAAASGGAAAGGGDGGGGD